MDYLTTKQLCEKLGICRYTLRKKIRLGQLPPPMNLGSSRHYFNPRLVDKYLEKQQKQVCKLFG